MRISTTSSLREHIHSISSHFHIFRLVPDGICVGVARHRLVSRRSVVLPTTKNWHYTDGSPMFTLAQVFNVSLMKIV